MLAALLSVAIYTDWRWTKIFNVWTYPAILAGIILGLLEGFPGQLFGSGFVDHLAAAILAFAVFFPFYAGKMLKAGDVKLLMSIGALRGTTFLLAAGIYGSLIGGVFAIGFVVVRRLARAPVGDPGATSFSRLLHAYMPYGVAPGLGGPLAAPLDVTGDIHLSGV